MLERMEHQESLDLPDLMEALVREDTQALRDLLDPRCSAIDVCMMTLDMAIGLIGSSYATSFSPLYPKGT